MRVVFASLLLATAVGLGSAAYAADPPKPAATADHGMMGQGAMGMGAMLCMGLSDESLAAAQAELNITGAQTPQWNAFVEAEKSSAAAMRQGMMHGAGPGQGAQPGSGMMMTGPLPARLERQETIMTARLGALRKVRAAASPLYAALSADQKAKADRLLCGQMGGQAGGQMGRHGPGPAARPNAQHDHPQ